MAYDDIFVKGTNSHDDAQIIEIMFRSSSTGQGITGKTFSDFTCYYVRQGQATGATAVTLATATIGTYTDSGAAGTGGGFVFVDSTNSPGVAQFSIPDAVLATGANSVTIHFKATGVIDKAVRLLLVASGMDLRTILATPTNITQASGVTLTATTGLGNQTANITGNLSGSVGSVTGAVGSVTSGVTVTTNNDKTGYSLSVTPPTAAAVADAVWDEAMADHLTGGTTGASLNGAGAAGDPWTTSLPGAYGAGTAGKIVGDNLNAPVATIDTIVDAIKAKTDNLPASPAAVGSAMTLANDAVSAAAVAADAGTEIADAILARDIGSGTGAGTSEERTVRSALRVLRNKFSISGTTRTVYKENDTDAAFTSTLTTDAAGVPITGDDPT